jgi:O-antigen/teichoic acid export membrane protein
VKALARLPLNKMENPGGATVIEVLQNLKGSSTAQSKGWSQATAALPQWNKQVLHTVVGMGIFQISTFIASVLIARALGAEGQGKFQLLTSLVACGVILGKMGLDEGVAYVIPHYKVQEPRKLSSLILYALGSTFSASILLGAGLYFFAPLLDRHIFRAPGFASDLHYALWLLPTLMLVSMGMAILRGLGRSDLRAGVYYYGVGGVFLALLFIFTVRGITQPQAYLARGASFGVGASLALWCTMRNVHWEKWRLSFNDVKSLHAFSGLLVFVSLFQYAVEQPLIDLILVGRLASTETVGVYSIAAKVGALVGLVGGALSIVMGPALAEAAARGDREGMTRRYVEASAWMAHLSVVFGAMLFFLKKEVLGLFGSDYQVGVDLVVLFLLAQVVVGVLGVNAPLLLATGHAKVEMLLTSVCSVIMLLSGMMLGRLYGPIGVALGATLSMILLGASRSAACFWLLKLNTWKQIIRVLFAGISGSLVGGSAQMLLTHDTLWGRLLAIVLFCVTYAEISTDGCLFRGRSFLLNFQ